jgi:serine/threonine-protein kinase
MEYESGMLLEGKYALLQLLDEGGMSWIWLARHEFLDAPVVVKILKPHANSAAEARSEGRIAARLRHPSIVAVFDSGRTSSGDSFLVMEHLSGSPLSEVLKRDHRLPARPAVELLLPVLEALSFCHTQGVVHRDLKPGNIFFAREHATTRAKLLDFGVAMLLRTARELPELA